MEHRDNFFQRLWRRRRHKSPAFVVLHINEFSVILAANKGITIMDTINVGHKDNLSIEYLDQNGNPMLATPTPDSAATWTDTAGGSAAATSLAVAADGNSAVATGTAVGSDTIGLSVTVGGKTFTASLVIQVTAAPQVLTSVAIASQTS